MNYFNAGFFIANRQRHAALFYHASKHGHTYPKRWGDQCVLNRVIEKSAMPVRYLDRRFNCLDYGEAFQMSDVRVIHSASNYAHYKAGTFPMDEPRVLWEREKMKELAGFYCFEFEDSISNLGLLYDGTTSEGHLWFAGVEGQIVLADVWGNDMRQPVRWRRMG